MHMFYTKYFDGHLFLSMFTFYWLAIGGFWYYERYFDIVVCLLGVFNEVKWFFASMSASIVFWFTADWARLYGKLGLWVFLVIFNLDCQGYGLHICVSYIFRCCWFFFETVTKLKIYHEAVLWVISLCVLINELIIGVNHICAFINCELLQHEINEDPRSLLKKFALLITGNFNMQEASN